MPQKAITSKSFLNSKAPYILAIAVAFFVYELWLLANSFGADYHIYNRVAEGGFTFWGTYWLIGELFGEVSLILRFAGACFFVSFASVLFSRDRITLTNLRWGVFFEGIQYVFFLPFISYLYFHPYGSIETAWISYKAASSYIIQLVLITPIFLILFLNMRKPNIEKAKIVQLTAAAAVVFLFALWAKHFIFSLYALPLIFDFESPILFIGSLNSILTLLLAAVLFAVAATPVIRRADELNWKLAGIALCLVTTYFVIFIFVAINERTYMSYIELTELWAASMGVAGAGFLLHKTRFAN